MGNQDNNASRREPNQARVAQYTAVKNRLNKKFAETDLTINKLRDELNRLCDFEINYETLRKTLDRSSSTLDVYCVIAMCKYFNMDVAYALAEADRSFTDTLAEATPYLAEKFTELTDSKYFGTFYGYMYSPKRTNPGMDSFVLEVGSRGLHTMAHISITHHTRDSVGEPVEIKRELVGRPVLVRPGIIYIVFTEPQGSYYIFSYSYVQYNKSPLYYRRGAILTQGRQSSRQPLVQSFVLFNHTVAPENMDIIRGLLLLNDQKFHIPMRALDELARSNDTVGRLVNHLQYIFDNKREAYYLVDETQILHSLDGCMTKAEAIGALQIMKTCATDATRVFFPDLDDYAEFSKNLTHAIRADDPPPRDRLEDDMLFVD